MDRPPERRGRESRAGITSRHTVTEDELGGDDIAEDVGQRLGLWDNDYVFTVGSQLECLIENLVDVISIFNVARHSHKGLGDLDGLQVAMEVVIPPVYVQ